jgi:glycosyltransferase involved in cell wall biosynthesis
MRIAFYAPLKPPDHPVPSGDRQMARLLIAALERGGHTVEVVSRLRAYLTDNTQPLLAKLQDEAAGEINRISQHWREGGLPDLWITYHPYYRAPDLLGPRLTSAASIGYVTVEASHAPKRDRTGWAEAQAFVVEAVRAAALNICVTARDRDGLMRLGSEIRTERLLPFIDTEAYGDLPAHNPGRGTNLIAVAMMRKGDKFDSYRMLASALQRLGDVPWQLTVIGDGPLRDEIKAMFGGLLPGRMNWIGEVPPGDVAKYLAQADLYCWPGCGEAYGLAYLEAQAAGTPVVAQDTAGVPEVVLNGTTGLLTPTGDVEAYAKAIRMLATDKAMRERLSGAARQFVLSERSLEVASVSLNELLAGSHETKSRAVHAG